MPQTAGGHRANARFRVSQRIDSAITRSGDAIESRWVYVWAVTRAREWLRTVDRGSALYALPVAVLVVLGQIETWSTSLDLDLRPLAAAVLLAMTLVLAWRRRHPLVVAAVVCGGLVTVSLAWDLMDNFVSPFGALLVAIYSIAAYASFRTAVGVYGLLIAFILSGALFDSRPIGDLLWVASILTGVWAAGRGVHLRQQRVVALADHAVALEHERDAKARAAVAEERVRIARELHDVVAHGISVIVLQARGGRKVLDPREAEAREAFEEIETTAQQALTEMRRLLGMLRRQDEELALGPQPSLANLDSLAASVRDAGLPVDVVVNGRIDRLPPAVDLSAYRLVQEGLTNALKHAGPAHARVFVNCSPDEVEVEVTDDGLGVNGNGMSTGGHGLTGMRERVAMLGGRIDVGPQTTGGFALRARLPLDGSA
jgi:signal transduction histidine kinase